MTRAYVRSITLTAIVLLFSVAANAADWARFRGPNGTGVSQDTTELPTKWTPKDVKWKVKLPGPGVSSPIVVGDKCFVTCYSGYGVDRSEPGEMKDLKRHLVCLDVKTGKVHWDRPVKAVLPEDPYSGIGVPAHGYASHTPVSDGKNVYVFFGKTGAIAFDLEGKQLWQKSAGTGSDARRWGSSSSPIIFKDLLIVTASAESLSMYAFKTSNCEQVWKQEADGLDNLWGTPTLVEVEKNRTDLVVGVPYEIWGLNPENGKLRWYCEAMESEQFNSSVVPNEGILYAVEGRGGGSIAVKAGGKGDITKTNVVWNGRDSTRFASPVVHEGRMYVVSAGLASCVNVKDGKQIYRSRLSAGASASSEGGAGGGRSRGGGRRGGFGGGEYASPVIGDGKLYYVKGNGTVHVLKLGDKFEELAVNKMTEDSESFGGTPAISNGRLLFRSNKHLYCIGK